MPDRFKYQTDVAFFDIAFQRLFEDRPIILPHDELSSLIETNMASQRVVVMAADKFCLNDFLVGTVGPSGAVPRQYPPGLPAVLLR